MLKKLLLIFALVLILCSCEVQKEPEIPKTSKPVFEEENPGESCTLPEDSEEKLTRVQEAADKYIFEYEFRYNEWMEELAERGVYVSFENRVFTGEDTWEAELVLVNDKTRLSIPFSGIYDYSGRIYYGKVLFPDDKTAVFCGNKKAVFFDTETLEIQDFEPEFPDFGKENIWINGAGINEKTNGVVLFATPLDTFKTDDAETVLIAYNGNKPVRQDVTKLRGTARDGNRYNPLFFVKADFFENNGITFFNSGYEFFEVETGKVWELGSDQIFAENGIYRLEMVQLNPKDEGYVRGNYLALLFENGKITKSMIFSEPEFCDPNYAREEGAPILIVKGDVVTYRFAYFAMTLTLDFGKGIHEFGFNPTEMNIDDNSSPIRSSDGKYTIYNFGFYGAGDVMRSHVAVRNNETGKHNYLGEIGGMYGGYNGLGFLKNNDIYNYSNHSLKILDPETLEVKFDINNNFPLGYDEETDSERGILTFRRNPEDFSYIVVYYEYENGWDYTVTENENIGRYESADFNYKIGFLDSEGKLLESYESDIPMAIDVFGINEVNMRYSEETLTLVISGGKANPDFEIVFDRETKEFKAQKTE